MFDTGDAIIMSICIVAFVLGWVLSVAFLYALYQDNRGGFKSNFDTLCFYLVMIEAGWATLMIWVDVWIAVSNGISDSKLNVCVASATCVWLGASALTAMHAVMAFDRLYNIMTLKPMSRGQLIGVFLVYFVSCMSIFAFGMSRPDPLQVWSTESLCFFPVYTNDANRRLPFLIVAGYIVFWIVSVIGTYAYLAYLIYYRGQMTQLALNNNKSQRKQRVLLTRCLLVLATIGITFGPNILALAVNVFIDVPKSWYQVTLLIEILDGILTPILLLYLKPKNWIAFKKHVLGWVVPLPSTKNFEEMRSGSLNPSSLDKSSLSSPTMSSP